VCVHAHALTHVCMHACVLGKGHACIPICMYVLVAYALACLHIHVYVCDVYSCVCERMHTEFGPGSLEISSSLDLPFRNMLHSPGPQCVTVRYDELVREWREYVVCAFAQSVKYFPSMWFYLVTVYKFANDCASLSLSFPRRSCTNYNHAALPSP